MLMVERVVKDEPCMILTLFQKHIKNTIALPKGFTSVAMIHYSKNDVSEKKIVL